MLVLYAGSVLHSQILNILQSQMLVDFFPLLYCTLILMLKKKKKFIRHYKTWSGHHQSVATMSTCHCASPRKTSGAIRFFLLPLMSHIIDCNVSFTMSDVVHSEAVQWQLSDTIHRPQAFLWTWWCVNRLCPKTAISLFRLLRVIVRTVFACFIVLLSIHLFGANCN